MSAVSKTKLPLTIEELLQFGDLPVQFSGTYEDFLFLAESAEFSVEFHDNTIYTTSIASDAHETIVKNILVALSLLLDDDPDINILSSNRHIHITEAQKTYSPDVHVILGKPIFHILRKGLDANINPWLVVEVLSPSTSEKDWNKKLPNYKKIPSLRHILYVEQNEALVCAYHRKDNTSVWESIDYDDLNASILIEGQEIPLKKIYKKVL